MNDDDLDLDGEETYDEQVESQPADPAGLDPAALRKELDQARRDAAKYRTQLRRTQLAKDYGDEILELVPETLPVKDQKELAAKLKERLGSQQQTSPTEQVEAAEPPEVEVPAGLAAVSGAPSPPSSAGVTLSAREIHDLMQRDPAAAMRAAQAKYGGSNR